MLLGKYLDTKEAAKIIGVHGSRISHFVKAGDLQPVERVGTAMFFLPSDVARFAKKPRKRGPKKKEKNTLPHYRKSA